MYGEEYRIICVLLVRSHHRVYLTSLKATMLIWKLNSSRLGNILFVLKLILSWSGWLDLGAPAGAATCQWSK